MYKRGIVLLSLIAVFIACLCINVGAIAATDYCGDNVHYVYDAKTKSVTISGDGDMYDYANAAYSPFYLEDIASVIIKDDVTSIGDNAFFGCETLESVIISDSVSSVGNSAFEGCYSLTELVLSDNLTHIGKKAFMGCEALTEIILPSGVTSISEASFKWCYGLTSLIVSGDIQAVADDAFSNCKNLASVHFNKSVDDIDSAVIGSFSPDTNIHGTACKVTVEDCLTGITHKSLYCSDCNKDVFSETSVVKYDSHSYGEYISDGNHTCLTDGTKTALCSRCGKSDTVADIGSSKGHSWKSWSVILPATCEQYGEKTRECISCSTAETEKIPATAHKNAYTAEEISPTCKQSGYSEGVYCPDCEIWISGHTEIPSQGHSGGTATCIQKAACLKCGDEYGGFDYDNHLSITVLPGKEATCTENGYTQSSYCSDCEKTVDEKTVIDASGHTEVKIEAVGATCVNGGATAGIRCSVCEAVIKVPQAIAPKGHSEKLVSGTAATCTKQGLSDSVVCSSCDAVIKKAEIIPAKGHNETDVKGKEATCTAKGLTDGKRCSACKEITVTQKEIPLKAHTYVTYTDKKATLTAKGKTVKRCSCGAVKANSGKSIYSPKKFSLSSTEYTYSATVKTPSVTVKDKKGNVLKITTDYDLKYESGRKSPGRYTVTVTFKGKYSGTKKLYFTIAPKATEKITASQSTSSITLNWNKVTGADGYRVYKYNSETKKYEKVKDVSERSLKITGLKSGTDYKFKVKAYRKDGGKIWGKASDAYSFSTLPDKPSGFSASTTATSVTFKWKKVKGADGYAIYRYSSGEWKRIDTVTSGSKVSCKINSLKSGTAYKFRIKAFKKSAGKTLWSSASESITAMTKLSAPTLSGSSAKKGIVTLKWSNVSGESGYEVYYSTEKNGKFKKLSAEKADVSKLTKNLQGGKTYYFKVRAYKKTADGTLYSPWSSACKVEVKK